MMFFSFRDSCNIEHYIALDSIKMIKWPYDQWDNEYYDIVFKDNHHLTFYKCVDKEAFVLLKQYLEENSLK